MDSSVPHMWAFKDTIMTFILTNTLLRTWYEWHFENSWINSMRCTWWHLDLLDLGRLQHLPYAQQIPQTWDLHKLQEMWVQSNIVGIPWLCNIPYEGQHGQDKIIYNPMFFCLNHILQRHFLTLREVTYRCIWKASLGCLLSMWKCLGPPTTPWKPKDPLNSLASSCHDKKGMTVNESACHEIIGMFQLQSPQILASDKESYHYDLL
mgnify:CR=1 FL=1